MQGTLSNEQHPEIFTLNEQLELSPAMSQDINASLSRKNEVTLTGSQTCRNPVNYTYSVKAIMHTCTLYTITVVSEGTEQ